MKRFIVIAISILILASLSNAQETNYPTKPVTIIVPFPPGGFLDLGARTITESLSKELKVPVVVENRAGGAGLVGATAFLSTKPDGHTVLSASGAAVISVTAGQSPLARRSTVCIPVEHSEDVTTFVSMISRILHLLVVDMLSVGLAVRRAGVSALTNSPAVPGQGAAEGQQKPAPGVLISHIA